MYLSRMIFTDSNGIQWPMCWGYCDCYVYYTVYEGSGVAGGRCGRCREGVVCLDPFLFPRKDDALMFFYEYHGHMPKRL